MFGNDFHVSLVGQQLGGQSLPLRQAFIAGVPRNARRIAADRHKHFERRPVFLLDVLGDLMAEGHGVTGLAWRD